VSGVITKGQLAVLRRLEGSRERRARSFGLNAGDFGGKAAAAMARAMERKGYVLVDDISDVHKRYSITTSGEQLIRSIDAGRPWLVKGYRHRAAITPTPDTPTAEVAVQPITRSGRNSRQNQGDPQ
jgi:hypothetical protein